MNEAEGVAGPGGGGSGGGVRASLAGLACVGLCVVAGAAFLGHQSLWNDELTQLGGLELGPVEQVRWLTGRSPHEGPAFGAVSVDRMPPLSYWAGSAWSRAFGGGERSLRWFGLCCVAMATALVFDAARRAWGLVAGTAAGLLMALSPNVITMGVEIRAYPLLILTAAVAFYGLVRRLSMPAGSDGRRWLALIAAAGVAASYTHFFGLVVCGGTLLAALVMSRARGERLGPALAAIAAVALLAAGLGPFVLNSVTVSAAGQEAEAVAIRDRLAGLARLGYRQYGHPSLTVRPAAVAAGTLGFAAAVGAALIAAARRPTGPAAGVAVALGAGAAVVAAATLAATTPTFAPSQASYNAWTLPGVALLLASGLAAADRRVRRAAALGVLILLADDAVGATMLAVRGSAFAHTSQRPIAERIARLGPDRTALVHDGGSPGSWMIYGPIRHRFDGQVRQYGYVGDGDGDDDEVRLAPYPETGTGATIAPGAVPARYLVVVRARRRGSAELAVAVRDGPPPLGDGPLAEALAASPRWERLEGASYGTFVASDVDVFTRADEAEGEGR